jgi:transcriptional regulator with XRE-family HTH domain
VPKPIGADKTRHAHTLGEAVGAEITRLRVSHGWSQAKLADVLGYDERYLRDIERGLKSPTLKTLSNVAHSFGIALSVLLARAERRLRLSK